MPFIFSSYFSFVFFCVFLLKYCSWCIPGSYVFIYLFFGTARLATALAFPFSGTGLRHAVNQVFARVPCCCCSAVCRTRVCGVCSAWCFFSSQNETHVWCPGWILIVRLVQIYTSTWYIIRSTWYQLCVQLWIICGRGFEPRQALQALPLSLFIFVAVFFLLVAFPAYYWLLCILSNLPVPFGGT